MLNPYQKSGKLKIKDCRLYVDIIESRAERKKIKSPFILLPRDWNFDKQEARISCPHHSEINKYIIQTKLEIVNAFVSNPGKSFDQVIDIAVNGSTGISRPVLEVFEEFLLSQKETKHLLTIRKHQTIRHYLVHDRFSDYNLQFFDSILAKMIQQKKVNDTINKTMGSFKTFFSWAKARGYHTNDVFELNKVGPSKSPRNEIVALTEEDCNALDSLSLEGAEEYIRNIFLISCHTGARISDVMKFNPKQLSESGWRFEAWKTRKNKVAIVIPFVGWCSGAKKYLERISKQSIPLTEQYVNRTLKELCARAGIDDEIRTTRMSGKNQIVKEKPKSQYVSFHTGRRTFISILLNKGMAAPAVMKLTGISSIKTLMKYLNTTDEDVLRELDKFA